VPDSSLAAHGVSDDVPPSSPITTQGIRDTDVALLLLFSSCLLSLSVSLSVSLYLSLHPLEVPDSSLAAHGVSDDVPPSSPITTQGIRDTDVALLLLFSSCLLSLSVSLPLTPSPPS
jgi:hypothetical protein